MDHNKPGIDTLLDSENCTLEKVLADNDVITECKWGNSKLSS